MRTIALALEQFSRFAGGAESYAISLAQTLIQTGWEVHLYGQSWDGEPSGAIFHPIQIPRWWPRWAKQLGFAFKHRRKITSQAFDVVMGFGNTICMNVYQSHGGVHWCASQRKLDAQSKVWLRRINHWTNRISLKQWTRYWIESSPFRANPRPRIIAISQMVKDDMVRVYGIDNQAIELVYNGVDTDRYNPHRRQHLRGPFRQRWGIGPEEVVFLFAGYELRKKGIFPLIESAGILKKQVGASFKVIVAGAKPYSRLERRIQELDLGRTVIFTGRLLNMEECFANSDVFVLPTFYDACSLVVLEALASGLPCITTQFNGAAGIMSDGKDGFVLDHPPQPKILAEKMRLLYEPSLRQAMGVNASNTALHFTIQRNHQEILKILDSIAVSGVKDDQSQVLKEEAV